MRGFKPSWFVVGGWAIDLYLGEVTRPHEDIEVGIFRKDQKALQGHLGGWDLQKLIKGELSVWRWGESLEPPIHEIHCVSETAEPRHLEVLLNESEGDEWVYRRNEVIRKPLADCIMTSDEGVPFLGPEVVLLYKSKNPRAKDEQDFQVAAGQLDTERRDWLKKAIAANNYGHHWLQSL